MFFEKLFIPTHPPSKNHTPVVENFQISIHTSSKFPLLQTIIYLEGVAWVSVKFSGGGGHVFIFFERERERDMLGRVSSIGIQFSWKLPLQPFFSLKKFEKTFPSLKHARALAWTFENPPPKKERWLFFYSTPRVFFSSTVPQLSRSGLFKKYQKWRRLLKESFRWQSRTGSLCVCLFGCSEVFCAEFFVIYQLSLSRSVLTLPPPIAFLILSLPTFRR